MMVPASSVLGAVTQTSSTSESKAYLCQSKAQNSATFRLALQIYIPMSAEFPDAETILGSYEDAIPSFAMVLGDLVEQITNYSETVHELDVGNI